MSTQSGITFFDEQNGFGYGISASSRASWSFKKLGFTRYDRLFMQNSNFSTFKDLYIISCTNHFDVSTATQFCKFDHYPTQEEVNEIVSTYLQNLNNIEIV